MIARRALLVTLLLFAEGSLHANDLRVSSTRAHLDESVQVTITLTGEFAHAEDLDLVLQNLAVETGPRTSTEFTFMNGVSSRRRTFVYTLRPKAPGSATVGPIVVTDDEGNRDTLGPIRLEILGDSTSELGGDPLRLLRYYASSSRARVAVGAEVDQSSALVGEQILVTWYVYTAESTESVQVTSAPPLSDFWVEEITVDRTGDSEVMVDGMPVRKVPVRRAAIYPLRDGSLTIPPLEVNAEVMEVIGGVLDRFGMMNTRTAPVRRRSNQLTVQVAPAPTGQVGSYTFRCSSPRVSAAGPVAFDAIVAGDGNLRSAQPPRFIASPDAEVQVSPGEMKVERKSDGVRMQRTWKFLLFPKDAGSLSIPTLTFAYFDPVARSARAVGCTFPPVVVSAAAETSSERDESSVSRRASRSRLAIPLVILIGAAGYGAYAWSRKRQARKLLEEKAREILAADTPFELRRRFDELLGSSNSSRAALMSEGSERGELTRAVSSLIEYRVQQPLHAEEIDDELRERLIELIAALRRTPPPP